LPIKVIVEGMPARLSLPLKSAAMIGSRVNVIIVAAEYKLCEAKSVTVMRCRAESEIIGVTIPFTFPGRPSEKSKQRDLDLD
jgi:hypothetical protein